MNAVSDAIASWKEADKAARDAEGEMQRAWDKVHAKSQPVVPEELINRVNRLRTLANERLVVVMAELKAASAPPPSQH